MTIDCNDSGRPRPPREHRWCVLAPPLARAIPAGRLRPDVEDAVGNRRVRFRGTALTDTFMAALTTVAEP